MDIMTYTYDENQLKKRFTSPFIITTFSKYQNSIQIEKVIVSILLYFAINTLKCLFYYRLHF